MCTGGQEESQAAIDGLKAEIARLRAQQIAAENMAARIGMTPEESGHYKTRHLRMRILTTKLAMLSAQGANHEQKETQEIAGKGARNPKAALSR